MKVLRYIAVTIVGVGSFALVLVLPSTDLLRNLATIPGVAALVALLALILRDEAAYQRELIRLELQYQRKKELQATAQAGQLGIASHMAELAFDKHVEFVEAYFEKVDQALRFLTEKGPHRGAIGFANDLHDIRGRFTPWLTEEMDEELAAFEHQSLRIMGAKTELLEHVKDEIKRTELLDQTYGAFEVILGMKAASDESKVIAGAQVIQRLRDFLGIGDLAALREQAIDDALSTTGQPTESDHRGHTVDTTEPSREAERR